MSDAAGPPRWGGYVVLDSGDDEGGPEDAVIEEDRLGALKLSRVASLAPFAPGPFTLLRPVGVVSSAWRIAVRDYLRLPASPSRVTLRDAPVDDPRAPWFFVTEAVFGVRLRTLIDVLEMQRGTLPREAARALVDEVTAQLSWALALKADGVRSRPGGLEALVVTWDGRVVDDASAPFALNRGPAAGTVDLARVSRAYGAALLRLSTPAVEHDALALLQSPDAAQGKAPARESDATALASFLGAHFVDRKRRDQRALEEHALLDPKTLRQLFAR